MVPVGGARRRRSDFHTAADPARSGSDPAGPGCPGRSHSVRRSPGRGAAPGGPAIGIAIAPAGRIVVRGGWNGQGAAGLTLQDDKGAAIPQIGSQIQFQSTATPNGVVTTQMFVLTFQPEKGQEASKLVYLGRKMLSVEIPFTLKDVPLP